MFLSHKIMLRQRLLKMSLLTRSRIIALLIIFVVGTIGINLANTQQAEAVSAADWKAGRIIDDNVFFTPGTLSATDIQNFLNSKVPVCDTWHAGSGSNQPPFTCLKTYVQSFSGVGGDAYCSPVGGGTYTSSSIIYKVAQACGINAAVLIVLLEKEQSLITDTWPWAIQYRSATGYGCPDTAACDAKYYGFFNQVYNAAWQFKYYAANPAQFRYKPYQNNTIQYNPNASCGSSTVYIENRATAALYNYTPYQPNAAALAAGWGEAPCGAYGNRNFWKLYNDWFGSSNRTLTEFKSLVSGSGWTNFVINSGVTGTTGQSKPMQAFKINGEVEYSSYNYATGWQPTVSKSMISGTNGLNRSIQAIKIKPIQSLGGSYDIYYRAHVSEIGWMGWAKNGEVAGITGDNAKNIEAFEIAMVSKGSAAPGSTANAYQNGGTVSYHPYNSQLSMAVQTHVQDYGWQPAVSDTMIAGTTEQGRRVEALSMALSNSTGLSGNISYQVHVSGIGWMDITSAGNIAGTTGQGRQIEAVRVALSGNLANSYDVYYRAHVSYLGWLDWGKNGQPAGSMGAGIPIESLEARIVPKNSVSLPTANALYNPKNSATPDSYTIGYSAHVSTIGWMGSVPQYGLAGTTGRSKSVEAISFNAINSLHGNLGLDCSSYVKGVGWASSVPVNGVCGTTGQSRPIQSIKLSLTGDAASKYDVSYRVHLSNVGWQNWVLNGAEAGTPNGNNIEAVTVRLTPK